MLITGGLALLVIAAASSSSVASPLQASPRSPIAPLYIPDVEPQNVLNDTFIVMFKDDITPSAFSSHMQFLTFMNDMHPLQTANRYEGVGSGVRFVYDSVVARGYSGRFSEDVINMVRWRSEVKYIEQDQIIRLDDLDKRKRAKDKAPHPEDTQWNPTWVCTSLPHHSETCLTQQM